MNEKRKHIRTAFRAHIRLMHPVVGEQDVEMRDMSDGGVFLLTENRADFPVGEVLQIQARDIEDAPVLTARVVRHESAGIGLMFIEE
jgi:PilZ domain